MKLYSFVRAVVLFVITALTTSNLFTQILFGINHVPDGGFCRLKDSLPLKKDKFAIGEFDNIMRYWYSPTNTTPDLYSYEYIEPCGLKLPKHFLSSNTFISGNSFYPNCSKRYSNKYDFEIANSDSNFVGLVFGKYYLNRPIYIREAIQTKIVKLKKGVKYKIEMDYLINPLCYNIIESIDILLSDSQLLQKIPVSDTSLNKYDFLASPSLSFDIGGDTIGEWNHISKIFKAGQDYNFLTISYFGTKFRNRPIIDTCFSEVTYLFLDNISIKEVSGINSNDTVCFGDSIILKTTLESPNYWSYFSDGRDTISSDSSLKILARETFRIYSIGKLGVDSAFITVINDTFFNIKQYYNFCEGDSLRIDFETENGDYFYMGNKIQSPLYINSEGTFYVTKVSSYGCKEIKELIVALKSKPDLKSVYDTMVCFDEIDSFKLKLRELEYYNFNYNGEYTKEINVTSPQILYLKVVDSLTGCFNNESINIQNSCEPNIFIPNSFNPLSSSMKNRIWQPKVIGGNIINIEIFNRWGQKIWECSNCTEGWVGDFDGRELEEGLYLAVIKVLSDEGKLYYFQSLITLLR